MILAPVASAVGPMLDSPVTVRLIGTLDRVLIESFADAFAGLTAAGRRTLLLLVRDLTLMGDESLDRFLELLTAYEAAGHRVFVNGTPTWRKVTARRGARFADSSLLVGEPTHRQIIICHSLDKRAG